METLGDYLEVQALWQRAFAALVEVCCQLYLSDVKYIKATDKLSSNPKKRFSIITELPLLAIPFLILSNY